LTFPNELIAYPLTEGSTETFTEGFSNKTAYVSHGFHGLAQLIFLLLFAGRHPFSGVPKGPRQLLPEEAIREYPLRKSQRSSISHHIRGDMLAHPVVTDVIEATFDVAFQHPLRRFALPRWGNLGGRKIYFMASARLPNWI